MKPTLRLPSDRIRLLLGFVIALALHGFALSFLQLKQSRERPPQTLTSRDNTPELLQFASQASAPSSFPGLTLPNATVLPPPPSKLITHRQPALAGGKTVKMKASSQPKLKQPRIPTKGRLKLAQRMRPASERSEDWPLLAVQHLRRFQRQERETGVVVAWGSLPDASDQERLEGLEPGPQGPVSPQPEDYQALWNRSQLQSPVAWQKVLAANPGPAIEVRQLPVEQSKEIAVQIQHRQIVVLGPEVILFWIDGSRLWMLQSARTQASRS
jgi:hypothetical protein